MPNVDTIRAWKDPEYRASLTEGELAALPPNPAGPATLTDAELDQMYGGFSLFTLCGTCGSNCGCSATLDCGTPYCPGCGEC